MVIEPVAFLASGRTRKIHVSAVSRSAPDAGSFDLSRLHIFLRAGIDGYFGQWFAVAKSQVKDTVRVPFAFQTPSRHAVSRHIVRDRKAAQIQNRGRQVDAADRRVANLIGSDSIRPADDQWNSQRSGEWISLPAQFTYPVKVTAQKVAVIAGVKNGGILIRSIWILLDTTPCW